jgi:hypothetical protein
MGLLETCCQRRVRSLLSHRLLDDELQDGRSERRIGFPGAALSDPELDRLIARIPSDDDDPLTDEELNSMLMNSK